jgi:hypothetical protein
MMLVSRVHYSGEHKLTDLRKPHQWRVLLVLIAGVALLSVLVRITGLDRSVKPGPNKLGVHVLLDDGRNYWPQTVWPEHIRYARMAVGDWGYVTQLVRSDDLDPAKWQVFMDLCAEHHLIPIVRLATTFDRRHQYWLAPSHDADGRYHGIAHEYAQFIAALDWPADQHFVVVGNEPNHGNEWSGVPDPAAYARFLIDVSDALHAADPGARVLNAGFDPYAPDTGGQPMPDGFVYLSEELFIEAMAAAEPSVFQRIDAWASHAYADSHFAAEPASGVKQGINVYHWELSKLETHGVRGLKVMITETGWRHSESVDPTAADHLPDLPDAEQIAAYFDLAFFGGDTTTAWIPWLDDPLVIAVTPFAFDGSPREWGHTNWLILEADGSITGTYPVFDLFASKNQQD